MKSTTCLTRPAFWTAAVLTTSAVAAVVAALLLAYRSTYKPTWSAFLLSPPGWMFLAAAATAFLLCSLVVWRWDATSLAGRRLNVHCRACARRGIAAVFVLACLAVVAGEVTLRSLAVRHIWGEEVQGRLLLPRGWGIVQDRYRPMVERMGKESWYFVEDPRLGWTVGQSRQSADGLFRSGPGRFRTAVQGVEPNQEAPCRIALIGDSFTFGEEAAFEQTWAYYLQQRIGTRCRILNYAVPSYGIGQMYLRLQQDVLPQRPDLVIMGYTDGGLDRTLGVYSFLMGLAWVDSPWVGPRFMMDGDRATVVNMPLPKVSELYERASIRDLPFVVSDRWYYSGQWEQAGWGPFYHSYLFRYLTSLYPIHNVTTPEVSDEARATVNRALFQAIHREVTALGAPLMLVYLPTMEDYGERRPYREPASPSLLKAAGLPLLDQTECLRAVDPSRRFLEHGIHYTPEGEQRVAECLYPEVERRLRAAGRANR
ncbi:MAG: SGNH/GDSL hydrolase family protein [Nitrospiraceae bacterium]